MNKELESLECIPKITSKDILEKYTGKNKSDMINRQKLIEETDRLDAAIQYAICEIKYDRKDNNKMCCYYEIIKSWWEVFPDKLIETNDELGTDVRYEKNRVKRRISFFRYETYEEAHEAAIKIRKKDPYYRYDLGDRIYVRKCCK